MPREIRESDWKRFRELHPIALERFCQRTLTEIGATVSDGKNDSVERYHAVAKLVREHDEELRSMFDDMRRSTALEHIAFIQRRGLFTSDEMASFSEETREIVRMYLRL